MKFNDKYIIEGFHNYLYFYLFHSAVYLYAILSTFASYFHDYVPK